MTTGTHVIDTGKKVRGMPCPHCGSPSRIRTSKQLSPLLKELTYQCQDWLCGHTFIATVEVTRTLSPSGTPNPEIDIPLSPFVRRTAVES